MYLVISEKPSVSQSIGKVLGAYIREDGFLRGRDCVVSWCLGHLAGMWLRMYMMKISHMGL